MNPADAELLRLIEERRSDEAFMSRLRERIKSDGPLLYGLSRPPQLQRPSWDTYFTSIALMVAQRGNCLRKQVGCVIVVENRIVSAGYNGPPSGVKSCVDGPEFCPCAADPGSFRAGTATISRDLCPSLHAEQNAVAYAGRECKGGTAYITTDPCRPCHRLLQSAGVVRIVVEGEDWIL